MADVNIRALFLAHRRELLAYLTDKVRDRETAAELTQEAFLRYAQQGSGVRRWSIRDPICIAPRTISPAIMSAASAGSAPIPSRSTKWRGSLTNGRRPSALPAA